MTIEGKPVPKQGEEFDTHYQSVSPGYLEAIGVPLLKGRWFTAADIDTNAQVAVINDIYAKQVYPNEDPIGKRVRFGRANSSSPWITIVGVAKSFRHYTLPEEMKPAIYLNMLAYPAYSQTFVLRTTQSDPAALIPAMRSIVSQIDPSVPLYEARTFDEVVSRSVWRQRFQAQVLGTFAIVALILACAGIYGLMSWNVSQRTRELGLRMALGAKPGMVVRLIVQQGTLLALAGVTAGVGGALVLTRVMASLLYGIEQRDTLSFVAGATALMIVAAGASLVPAWRASRVDPAVAMQAD
jgi:predicted permease